MIIITQHGWDWPELDEAIGETQNPPVDYAPHQRVSALLGPDGELLMIGYERNPLGFDLRPKK